MRVALCVLVLAFLGCNKREESPPAAEAPAAPPPQAEQAAPQEEPEHPLDAAKAKAFIAYQTQMVPFTKEWGKTRDEFNKKAADGKFNGTTGAVRGQMEVYKVGTEVGDKMAAMRKSAGLTEDEVTALEEIYGAVLLRTLTADKAAAKLAEMEKAIAAMPEAERGEAQSSLAEFKKAQDEMMSMKEVRENHGDVIVDAMLAEAPTLNRLREEMVKAAAEK